MKVVIVAMIVAVSLGGCLSGRAGVQAPPVHTAGGMVQDYEKRRQDEIRCTRAESDVLIDKNAKKSAPNPGCGKY